MASPVRWGASTPHHGEQSVTKLAEQYVTNASKRKANIGANGQKRQKCKSNLDIVDQRRVNNQDEGNLIAISADFDKWTV
jgi:hypothetical protein